MKELGITKGEWFWDGDPSNYDPKKEAPWLVAGDRAENIVIYGEIKIANIKDAELIADAGNTAQKCGLLPSELLKQRDELLEALKEVCKGVQGLPALSAIQGVLTKQYEKAQRAITKAEEK